MKITRPTILLALVLCVTALLVHHIRQDPSPRTNLSYRGVSVPPKLVDSNSPVSKPQKLVANDSAPDRATSAIANEAILIFDSASSLQDFLALEADSDFEILASNEKLLAVRIRINNRSKLPAISKRAAQTDFNYTLLTPHPIIPVSNSAGADFENHALDFMRVPYENADAGKGLTIAVLDTGIRNHKTLSGVNITQIDLSDSAAATDYASHGTAVASLIAGESGIAPAANLISIRVLDTEGIGDTFSLAEGIVRAVDAGANIINMSLGSYGTNQALANAIAYANSRDVVLVAAAGNEGVATLPYPVAYESVIAVSTIDANGHPTGFANQSADIDISAPGVGVYAAWEEEDWISFTGTSASAPYVSGAIAAVSSRLEISPSQAAALLMQNANDSGIPGTDAQTGAGYVDVQRTLDSSTPYSDLALSDLYLDPLVGESGEQLLHVSVQNRGTIAVATASVAHTLANGITQNTYLGPLGAGDVASFALSLNERDLANDEGYFIEARVFEDLSKADSVPENDSKRTTFRLTDPEE